MGHSEMLLAVAGLDKNQIEERTGKLAKGDWSGFSPAEQVAYQFAKKLSEAPGSVRPAEVQSLVNTFGHARAIDLIWKTCWCHYMTRVADGFQLPLEKENVFAQPSRRQVSR